MIPFGHRRTATAAMAVLVLAILAITFLAISEGPLVSFMTILAFGSLLPWVFEHGYGNRSYIMRIFSPTLFITAALALILRTSYGPWIPLVAIQIGVVGWCFIWSVFLQSIVRETDTKMLVGAQKFWHCVYLGVMGLGHVVLYVWYIHPLAPGILKPF